VFLLNFEESIWGCGGIWTELSTSIFLSLQLCQATLPLCFFKFLPSYKNKYDEAFLEGSQAICIKILKVYALNSIFGTAFHFGQLFKKEKMCRYLDTNTHYSIIIK